MKITFHNYDATVDTNDTDQVKYSAEMTEGCMILTICPFMDCPLRLEFAILQSGEILIRSWWWDGRGNHYAHLDEIHTIMHENTPLWPIVPTKEMAESLAGLFSGRIRVRGLKIPIGGTPQNYCPIDVAAEEVRLGKTLYLA